MTTWAQRLCLDIKGGRATAEDAFEILIRTVEDHDCGRQIESLPQDVLQAFTNYLAGIEAELAPGRDKFTVRLDSIYLHSFGFDSEKAIAWKRDRVSKMLALCRAQFQRPPQEEPNKAPEPTSGTVTPRAEPRVAPVPPVAHL